MENRIKVNGEWYIKEEPDAIPEPQKELELTHFEGCVYENNKYCFEVTRLYRDYDKNEFYSDGIDVKFTDKRTYPWKIDNWDNTTWLRGIFDNDRASIDEALEVMDIDGVKELKALVLELIEKGWIKYYNCENINIGKIRPEGYHGMSDLGFGKI
jgi:hypothetical protein